MNYLQIFGFKIYFAINYKELSQAQLNYLAKVCYLPNLPKPLLFAIFSQIVIVRNWYFKLFMKIWKYLQFETFFHFANQVQKLFLADKHILIIPKNENNLEKATLLHRRQAMSFIEFVRLSYYFSLLSVQNQEKDTEELTKTMNYLLAVCFHPIGQVYQDDKVEEKAKLFENLHPLIKYPLIESIRKEFDELIESYELIFSKSDSTKVSIHKIEEMQLNWLQVARNRAAHITELDKLLHLDASIVLFDYNEVIREYIEQKNNTQ
jgi:hypothetical protein